MRRVLDLAWLALLVFMAATWQFMPDLVGAPQQAMPRDQHMAVMLAVAVFGVWLTTRGALLVARLAPGLVNLPCRDHWLAPERREQTLADLGDRLAVLGLGLVLLFAGLHYRALQAAQPSWPQVPDIAWTAGGVALGLIFALWLLALMRRFGRLAPVTTPRPVRRSSRSRDLVWREVQPVWPLLVVLLPIGVGVGLGLFFRKADDHEAWLLTALPLLLTAALGRMVTEVHGDRLTWRFGWLPWPRWQVDLDEIVTAEPARSRWIEGWGIHVTSDGRLYNASGTQAVRLTLRDGRRLRLGTGEPRELLQLLKSRIAGD
ncbi:hypothetical protein ACG02S_15085 [Roseateles sp. DC23W]|uniref:PH domain-containing protein n=1 Tax=Pelomonas dachongensis TaxID=3299029 RepID=A0ABW7EPF9_9BURK